MAEKSHSDSGRIPPQDVAAEKSLLGAILISDGDEIFPAVSSIVQAKDFYEPRHQTIFEAMVSLYNKHLPIDTLTLTHEAHSRQGLALGALLAAEFLATAKPGIYTMKDIL